MGRQDGEQVWMEFEQSYFFFLTINAGLRAMALLEQP